MPSRYRSLSGAWRSTEKPPDPDSDSDTAPSLVQSHPMLSQPAPSSSSTSFPSLAYALPRRRFTRYFTLLTSLALASFILFLFTGASRSRSLVASGLGKPPAGPPAWEQFPFLKRYHGGIRTLVGRDQNVAEYPVSASEEGRRLAAEAMRVKGEEDRGVDGSKGFERRGLSDTWRLQVGVFNALTFSVSRAKGYEEPVKCWLDAEKKLEVPEVWAYEGVTEGFPDPIMGSYEALGLRRDVCFERFGRLGAYGYGYSRKYGGSGAGLEGHREGMEDVLSEGKEVDWRDVKLGEAQEACVKGNTARFRPMPKGRNHFFTNMGAGGPSAHAIRSPAEEERPEKNSKGKKYLPRTAVIIRVWQGYDFTPENLFYLRALVNELSLQSGAEYVVHFLVHVKDENLQIWADDAVYQRVLDDILPKEFRGMGTLWSERQMGLIYGGLAESFYRDLPVHGVYRSTYMPMQYLAHQHPEYDFFWHWEMDIRYTGHFYHLFDQVSHWAKQQPRKGLWERNARFYIPSEHGSWEDFRQMVRVHIDHGTASKTNLYAKPGAPDASSTRPEAPIWGPLRPEGEGDKTDSPDADPKPPTSYDADAYTWGVGEDADFMTFNPLFDPSGTNWILAEDVTGYNTTASYPPRRTAIITASRLSRRLLETMHRETALERHSMFSEMWPGSVALHHGYKAVYIPHPVYIDRAWPTSYVAAIFNNGRNGASGGSRTSVFSDERQHNFRGTTWYYDAGFAGNLWRRWLGLKVDGDGGEEEEAREDGEGRMCLPAMLLHPVKEAKVVFEHQAGEG
nr:hypothetical protein B0A51_12724 [Rachicladosporium sp. CCFEE 5018]